MQNYSLRRITDLFQALSTYFVTFYIFFSAHDGPQNNLRDVKAQDQPLSW